MNCNETQHDNRLALSINIANISYQKIERFMEQTSDTYVLYIRHLSEKVPDVNLRTVLALKCIIFNLFRLSPKNTVHI